ncbi:MAG: hypothetical protein AB1414_06025 [bacterium]
MEIHRSQFTKFSLFFISINFLSENMGFFTHWLNLYLGTILLLCLLVSYFPFKPMVVSKRLLIAGLFFSLLGFALLPKDIILRLTGVIFVLFGFGLFLRGLNYQPKEIPTLLFATSLYLFFIIFYKFHPFVWCGLQNLSLSFTASLSTLIRKDILLGHTFLGLFISLLLLFIILSLCLFSQKKKIFSLILSLVLVLFIQIVYVIGVAFLIEIFHKKDIFILILPTFLSLLLLIPLYFGLKDVEFQAEQTRGGKIFIPIIGLLVCFSIGFMTFPHPSQKSVSKEKVVFYEKGFLNWDIPTFNDFGAYSGGMFGNLPLFVARIGFEPIWTKTITQKILNEAKILVMINIEEAIADDEKKAIWEFVEKGGSLLLLGDHTFYKKGASNQLNDILEPVNIKYNFDSADYFIGGWLHSYQYLNHPITIGLEDIEDEPGIVVGASLKITHPAYPIIMGKYGYSDPGKEDNPEQAYLGNLDYDPNEQLGDIILVACQNYGQGKVLVFGDTSSFANSLLVFSHDFVNRVFSWLAE